MSMPNSIDKFIALSSNITRDVLVEEISNRLQRPIIKKYSFLSMPININWQYFPSDTSNWVIIFTIEDNTAGYCRNIMRLSCVYSPIKRCALVISDYTYNAIQQYLLDKSKLLLRFDCESDADVYHQLDFITETVFDTLKLIYE